MRSHDQEESPGGGPGPWKQNQQDVLLLLLKDGQTEGAQVVGAVPAGGASVQHCAFSAGKPLQCASSIMSNNIHPD